MKSRRKDMTDTTNDITLTPATYNRINQMVNFKPKHFTKLPYGHVGLKKLCELFPEHNVAYVRSKLEIIFWTKFNKNEGDRFNLLVNKIIEVKKINTDFPLIKIIHKYI